MQSLCCQVSSDKIQTHTASCGQWDGGSSKRHVTFLGVNMSSGVKHLRVYKGVWRRRSEREWLHQNPACVVFFIDPSLLPSARPEVATVLSSWSNFLDPQTPSLRRVCICACVSTVIEIKQSSNQHSSMEELIRRHEIKTFLMHIAARTVHSCHCTYCIQKLKMFVYIILYIKIHWVIFNPGLGKKGTNPNFGL